MRSAFREFGWQIPARPETHWEEEDAQSINSNAFYSKVKGNFIEMNQKLFSWLRCH